MKRFAVIVIALSAIVSGIIAAEKEWLPQGKSVETRDYQSANPNSPAAFSIVDSKQLNQTEVRGQKVYAKWCLPCHGVGMPATNALSALYQGTDVPALLEMREDFTPEIVEVFVRYGKHSMPFFRKTEINDIEMKFLGEYLSNAHRAIKK